MTNKELQYKLRKSPDDMEVKIEEYLCLRLSGGRGTLRLEEALKPDLHIPDSLI